MATRNIITHVESIFRKKDSSPFDIGVLACDFSSFSAEGRQEFIENVESTQRSSVSISRINGE